MMNRYAFAPLALVALLTMVLAALAFVPPALHPGPEHETIVAWYWMLHGLRS
jgi:hypothetical protein